MNYCFQGDESSSKEEVTDNLCKELQTTLSNTKKKIDQYPSQWEKVKKNIHDYEYVYTSSYYRKNVTSFSPISRSYFKLKEILVDYQIQVKNQMITCLAEAPGGFIQCLLETYPNIQINGITLVSQDKKIPFWNKQLLNHNQITFHTGIKNNGDLYDLQNVLSMINKIGKNSCSLITGDGGFDNSGDYNNQEMNSYQLLFSEIFMALTLQSEKGTFICKFFDIFLKETISLLYLLYLSYDSVIIHKPHMSRLSNSEKYIICLGFKGYNKDIVNLMMHHFGTNDFSFDISKSFIKEIYEFNEKYTQEQILSIQKGINIIKTNQIDHNPSSKQIKKSLEWCHKYNVPLNQDCFYI